MNKTKQEKWQRAYGDTPDSFRQRVASSLPKGEESRHVAFPRRAMVLAAALVLVLTTAYAAVVTHTELVWNAGHPIENEADDRLGLLTGKAGTSGDSLTIGGVTFTVQDGVYSPENGQLFASAVISADESVQLVAVEADMEHEVRLTTPVDAKLDPSGISWAEWAEQNGKTLVPIGMEAAPTLQIPESQRSDNGHTAYRCLPDAESGRHGVAGDSGGFDRGGHEPSEILRSAAGMPRRRVRQGWQSDAVAEGNPHRDDYVQITTKIFREVLTSGVTFGIIDPVADKECCYFQIHLKITESHSG